MKRRRKAPAAPLASELFPRSASRRYASPLAGDLLVLTSDEELMPWSRSRVTEVLVREAGLAPELAERLAGRVEAQVLRSRLGVVSTSVLRELVGAELLGQGLTNERERTARLGLSLHDAGRSIRGLDGAARPRGRNTPGSSAARIAGRIKRDYALTALHSAPVVEAHRRGRLHLHDLEAIDRPCSLESRPQGLLRWMLAAEGETDGRNIDRGSLGERLGRFLGDLRGHLAGPVGVEGLNVALAPFVPDPGEGSVAAFAAGILGSLSLALRDRAACGSPALVATLYWDLPREVREARVAGSGSAGVYGNHEGAVRALVPALLEAAERLQRRGSPELGFVLVLGPRFFHTPGHLGVLERAAILARRTGLPRFRFAREEGSCYPAEAKAAEVAAPRVCREAVLAMVSINLPRLAYGEGVVDEETVEGRLYTVLELAARAQMERRVFLEELLALGEAGPHGLLAGRVGRRTPFALEEMLLPILPSGLNELAELMAGAPLDEAEESLELGVRLMERMARHVESLSRRHRLRLVLGSVPDLEVAARFAKLDLRYAAPRAGHHVKGSLQAGRLHYTPGAALDVERPILPLQRVAREGRLTAVAPWGAFTPLPRALLGTSGATTAHLLMEAYRSSAVRDVAVVP